jgi:sterol 3beta-glucosyltransferase
MGPLPVPFADLSAQRLAAAIREALDEPYRNRARELARLVNAEDGAETVARRIEQLPG